MVIIETYNKSEIKTLIKLEVNRISKDLFKEMDKIRLRLCDIEQILRSLPTASLRGRE